MNRHLQRAIPIYITTLLLIVAAGLRLHNLDAQSLWYDEGVTFGHSQRTLFEILPRLQDNVHVPAYFASLALWEDFTGSSEFALRYYSVLWSVLSVAAAYAIGKRAYGAFAGIAAAALVAFNTFSIYYAQEARMYAMMTAIAGISFWLFIRLMRRAAWRDTDDSLVNRKLVNLALVYSFVNLLGMYTHISYALVMLAQGVLALLWLLPLALRSRVAVEDDKARPIFLRTLFAYLGASALTTGLFSFWLPTAISQISAQPNVSAVISDEQFLRLVQGWLGFGPTFEVAMGGMGTVMYFLLLFGVLLWPQERKGQWWLMLVPAVWVLLSVGIYWQLDLYERYLRFLLPAQLGFAVWLGRGLWGIWRIQPRTAPAEYEGSRRTWVQYIPQIIAMMTLVAYCVAMLRGLDALYNDPTQQRDDYRGIVRTIEREARADDAIILSAPGMQEIIRYYYEGDLPIYPLPTDAPASEDLRAIVAQHPRLFAIFYGELEQDPTRSVERALAQEAYPLDSRWFGDPRLLRFVQGAAVQVVDPVQASFADETGEPTGITLEAVRLVDTRLMAGGALRLQLDWSASSTPDASYVAFVQLLNSEGQLVAQRDSVPVNGLMPTTIWSPDVPVRDFHALPLPADLAAGEYTLIAGLYEAGNPSRRLRVGASDFIELGLLTVR